MEEQWKKEISKREVFIFGCGNTARQFCEQYRRVLPIQGFISNNSKETRVEVEDVEFDVQRPQVKKSSLPYIIVCSSAFPHIAEQLDILGYRPFQDYVDAQLAEVLLSNKKLVLLYGFCHLRGMKDYLNKLPSFKESYYACYFSNYLSGSVYEREVMISLLQRCGAFIYNQSITLDYHSINEALISRLSADCIRLCLPSIFFGGYFPQKSMIGNKFNRYAVKCESFDYTPFSYEDNWLNECIERGMTASDIWGSIQKGIINNQEFILENLDKEWKRNSLLEKRSDFVIVEYLKKNFIRRRLFRNEAHMENEVIYQYVLQTLNYLDIASDNISDNIQISQPLLNCSQHLILPEVGRTLGLEWDTEKEPLELYTYEGWRRVTPEEYVRLYTESCGAVRKLKMDGLLP